MIMRTTRNQRHKVQTKQTYTLKKLRTGKLILALVGSFAVGTATIATSVNATEWIARTAEEIKQDIGDFSKPYTIKWGDTLSAIQEATGIDYHKIAADNGIEDVNLIYAGNLLYNKNGYTAVANVQTGEVKVYQAQTPTPTSNTQAAVSNAVAKTVVKDVTDSKDEKVQEIKQELQQSVNPNGQATEKTVTQPAKPVEIPNKPTEQPAVKPVETPSQPTEQPTVKPVETPSQPVEKPTVKPVETSKGTPEVQPELPELVIEKGKPEVQPALSEATVETVDVNEEIPFKETTQEDPELYQGLTRRVEGTKGSEKVTYEVVKENGVEKSRIVIKREVTKPATDTIVYRGTKPPVTAKGEPLVQPALEEYKEKGTPEVQPELPEATVETVDINEEIPFKETTQDDPELYQGLTKRVEGTKGSEKVTYEVVKENGVEKSRTVIKREVITPAKDAIVYRGTKPPVTAKGEPLVQPALEEYVAKEKGDPAVQPALPEAIVETITERVEKEIVEKVIEDDSIAQGKSVVESNGTKPRTEQDYTVVKVNNEVVSKEAKGEPREIDGTPKVVRKGTGHLLKYSNDITSFPPAEGYTWESLNKMPDEEKSKILNNSEEDHSIGLDEANAVEDMKIATQLLNLKKLNEEFAKLVNAERATQGRKPLVADENLIKLAKIRSDEQAGVGSLRTNGKKHTRPEGRPFWTVFNDHLTIEQNDRYGTKGENALEHSEGLNNAHYILNATELARDMFINWKNSPGHYRNMMSDQYTSFGLSASYTPHSTTTPEYYTGKSMIGITVFANDHDLPVR
ncbi:G5 domain-containing protein [Granulicatella sp.]